MREIKNNIWVEGSGNVVALRDVIQLITNRPPRPRVVVQPGEGHISDAQAAALKRLVDEIVRIEAVKRAPRTYAGVWTALNTHMKVPSYRLIPAEKYGKAEGYLQRWLTRLADSPAAEGKMRADARRAQIRFIELTMKQGLDEHIRGYLDRKYNATSVHKLSEARLKEVYSYVAGLRRRKLDEQT